MDGAFTLVESETSDPVVQLENRRSTLLLHEDEDIEVYRHAIDQLDKVSFDTDESMRAIAETAKRWERTR